MTSYIIFSVGNSDYVSESMMKFLQSICEDEILGLEGREGSLASAISVLNVLAMADITKFKIVSEGKEVFNVLQLGLPKIPTQ